MTTSSKRIQSEDTPVEEPTTARTPVDASNTTRAKSLLSLATSFIKIPAFMHKFTKGNIILYDQIQRKSTTLDHLKADDSVPRSLRFKFEL